MIIWAAAIHFDYLPAFSYTFKNYNQQINELKKIFNLVNEKLKIL